MLGSGDRLPWCLPITTWYRTHSFLIFNRNIFLQRRLARIFALPVQYRRTVFAVRLLCFSKSIRAVHLHLGTLMSQHLDPSILPTTDHGLAIDIDPEAHSVVHIFDSLYYLLALDVPQNDITVFARRRDEGVLVAIDGPETATDAETLIRVTLVRLLDRAGDVVPEPQARVHAEGEDVAPVRSETDGRYGRVVFVHHCAEALAGEGVPYSAVDESC